MKISLRRDAMLFPRSASSFNRINFGQDFIAAHTDHAAQTIVRNIIAKLLQRSLPCLGVRIIAQHKRSVDINQRNRKTIRLFLPGSVRDAMAKPVMLIERNTQSPA